MDTTITLGQAVAAGISFLALGVSGFSLWVSTLNYFRDNAKLKTTCQVLKPWPDGYGEPSFQVSMVNAGRRPIILTTIGGAKGRNGISTYLKNVDGVRLGEGESFDYELNEFSFINTDPEGGVDEWDELWIQDSVGNRYRVTESRKRIPEFYSELKKHRKQV